MRSNALVALAALVAIPLAASQATAAPGGGDLARASSIGAKSQIIDVRKGGRGFRGGRGFKGGGFRGGRGFKGGRGFRGGRGFGGPRTSFRGRGHKHRPGKHWGRGRHHGHHHHFRRRFYGAPYYYGGYYPNAYYVDDYYYDDGPDDAVVYAEDGDAVARCEARYRSFDRASGTFLTYGGERKLCPYLK